MKNEVHSLRSTNLLAITIVTLALAGVLIAKGACNGAAGKYARFARRLARSYAGLWLGHWNGVMGLPR